jgi:hypothetical protein
MSTDFIALNQLKHAFHPCYSADLAPSDFCFLGQVKRKLLKYHPESLSELLVSIRVILLEIPWKRLDAVFLA